MKCPINGNTDRKIVLQLLKVRAVRCSIWRQRPVTNGSDFVFARIAVRWDSTDRLQKPCKQVRKTLQWSRTISSPSDTFGHNAGIFPEKNRTGKTGNTPRSQPLDDWYCGLAHYLAPEWKRKPAQRKGWITRTDFAKKMTLTIFDQVSIRMTQDRWIGIAILIMIAGRTIEALSLDR